ncbi:MAG TPA: hypothetical protein VMQ61_07630 [Thermoanaerobaculia bacterium]|nr:hypothetical protein [Thermoanaerobaculia bacterium]
MQNTELLRRLEAEIERRLLERFAALRDEFDRLRLEADRRWVGFLERFEQDFAGIVPAEMLEQKPEGGGGSRAGTVSIEDARTLDAGANQVETLHRFLELARRRASRVALLVSKGGTLGVWKAVGFSEHGLDDDAVRKITISLSESNPFARVLDGSPERLPRGNEISSRLSATDAVDAIVLPMVVKEKISGAVYADTVPGEESRFDPEGIGVLTFLAGLVVDRLAARKLRPAPPLRPLPSRREAPAEEDISDLGIPRPREVPLTPATVPEPPPELAAFEPPAPVPPPPPAEPVRAAAEAPAPEPAVSTGWEAVPPPAAAWSSPAATMRMPEVAPQPPTPPAPAWKPDAAAPAPAPAGAPRRLAGPLARAEGDERREEARRFAKLLVSEIKLYNERAVQEGREKGNLYERLKEDIDRSRQMYDERIPEDVRSSSNFFYEELVRTLADGRAEALGL